MVLIQTLLFCRYSSSPETQLGQLILVNSTKIAILSLITKKALEDTPQDEEGLGTLAAVVGKFLIALAGFDREDVKTMIAVTQSWIRRTQICEVIEA